MLLLLLIYFIFYIFFFFLLFHVNFYFLLFPFSFVLLVIMCALCIVFNKNLFREDESRRRKRDGSIKKKESSEK